MAHEVTILTATELRGLVKLGLPAIDVVERAFAALASGSVIMPPILSMAIPQANGEVDVKTAYIPGFDGFAIKVSPGFFDNPKLGLPSLNGLMILFSAQTGLVEALLLDNGYLTDVRTAAAGAVAARHLAPSTVETAGVIGTGIQARLQIEAAHLVRPFSRVLVWGRNMAKARACVADLADRAERVRNRAVDRFCDRRQQPDSGRHGVECPATVIGNDDGAGACVDCLSCIRRVNDAFHDHRQGGVAAQPFHLGPAGRDVGNTVEEDRFRWCQRCELGSRHVCQIDGRNVRRQLETGSGLVVPGTLDRRIDGQNDRGKTQIGDALDQCPVGIAGRAPVELEPVAAWAGGPHLCRIDTALAAQHHGCVLCRCTHGHGGFTVGMNQFLVGDRSHEDRVRQRLSEQGQSCRSAPQITQHARKQLQLGESLLVGCKCLLVSSAAEEIGRPVGAQ